MSPFSCARKHEGACGTGKGIIAFCSSLALSDLFVRSGLDVWEVGVEIS